MRNFSKSEAMRDKYLSDIHISVRGELKASLVRAVSGLRSRAVVFDDGMGSITVDIASRRGGVFIIAPWDQYHSISKNTYSRHMRRLPLVKNILEILSEYEEFFTDVSIGTLEIEEVKP